MNRDIIYLSGAIRAELTGDPRFGFLATPNMGNRAPDWTWGADTGCFSAGGAQQFHMSDYLRWLDSRPRESCLFATAPDVLGDPVATLERSIPAFPEIARLGFKRALVAQDGLELLTVPWDSFDCLFLGGRRAEKRGGYEWKLSPAAAGLAHEAKQRGKWVHMGRVNSFTRLKHAASIGCDSADGTFLKYGPKVNYARMLAWFKKLNSN